MKNEQEKRICLNRSIVNKANMDDRSQKQAFTYDWVRENITPHQLYEEVAVKGHSFCAGFLKEEEDGFCYKNKDNWLGSQILALDFDNKDSNHKKLEVDEYFSYEDAINDPYILKYASFTYTTPTHKPDHHRFRVVFLLAHFCNDKEKYEKAIRYLTHKFGGDPATTSIAQGFYGCKNAKRSNFIGNLLPPDEFDFLADQYDDQNKQDFKQLQTNKFELDKWELKDYDELLSYIFMNGKIPNSEWWKVPTILSAYCGLDEKSILTIISKYVEVGDALDKIRKSSKYCNDMTLGTLIWLAQKNGYKLPGHLRSVDINPKFWSLTPILDKDKQLSDYKYSTNDYKYQLFLENNGFCNFIEAGITDPVRIIDNVIYNSSEAEIRSFTLNYLEDDANLYPDGMISAIVKSRFRKDSNRVIPNTIKNLRIANNDQDVKFIRDEKKKTHLYFQDQCLVIEPNGRKLISYQDLEGYVYSDEGIKRTYIKSDGKTSIFQKFIERLSTTRKPDGSLHFSKDKFDSFASIIGYCTNKFKDKSNAKAIVITDPDLTLSDESNGSTGKSLFCKGLSWHNKMTIVDGRNFNPSNEFNLNHVDQSTDLCLINDFASSSSQGVDISPFYNYITDELQIRKLYKGNLVIPFEESPKFIFTMNKVLTGSGASDVRRKLEIEVSNYYSVEHSPAEEFGLLFDDWDQSEWARFDDFIVSCVETFYQFGLLECKPENLDLKRLQVNTSLEFAEYAELFLRSDTIYTMDGILDDYTDWSNEMLSPHQMTKYLKKWAIYSGTTYESEYLKSDSNKRLVFFGSNPREGLKEVKKTNAFGKLKLRMEQRPSKL